MKTSQPAPLSQTLLITGMLTSAGAMAGGSYVDFSAEYLHDDNIGRAEADADQLSDNIALFSGALQIPQLLGERSGLLHVLRLEYDRHVDWDDLSVLTASAGTTLRYKPGAAYNSPWFEPSFNFALMQHQDSDIRDGTLLRAGLTVGSNLTDRLTARLGYRYDWRQAWDADVYDLGSHRLAGSVDFELTDRATLYGTLGWQTGEVVSTATPSPKVLNASEARAVDEALSERPDNAVRVGNYYQGERVAYRLDADSLTGELGLNVALTRKLALDLSALSFSAWGEGNNDYDGLQLRAGLLYRY